MKQKTFYVENLFRPQFPVNTSINKVRTCSRIGKNPNIWSFQITSTELKKLFSDYEVVKIVVKKNPNGRYRYLHKAGTHEANFCMLIDNNTNKAIYHTYVTRMCKIDYILESFGRMDIEISGVETK